MLIGGAGYLVTIAGDTRNDAQAVTSVDRDALPPTTIDDPELHATVAGFCMGDRAAVPDVAPFVPGEEAAATVYFDQAIGAGSAAVRAGWVWLDVSPAVGNPQTGDAAFNQAPIARTPLAACMTRGGWLDRGVTCTYAGQLVHLMETQYDIEVFEVHSGTVVASGSLATDATTCPGDALVELSDEVSGPMTPELIAEWFATNLPGGIPAG